MTIIEENGKIVRRADGISDKWLFVGEGIGMIPWSHVYGIFDEEESDADRLEDALAKGGGFECRGTHTDYLTKLRERAILLTLPDKVKSDFYNLLSALADVIRKNNDKPATANRQILSLIKGYDPDTDENGVQSPDGDDKYIWKIIIKVLALQGVFRWMVGFGIKKRDDGYGEYQAILNHIKTYLYRELYSFCYISIPDDDACKNDTDTAFLRFTISSLSGYLAGTKMGGDVQDDIRRELLGVNGGADGQLPKELNTLKGENLLEKTIAAGLCDTNYYWNDNMTALACYVYLASGYLELSDKQNISPDNEGDNMYTVCWHPFEILFNFKNKKRNPPYNQIQQKQKNKIKSGKYFNSNEMLRMKKFFDDVAKAYPKD